MMKKLCRLKSSNKKVKLLSKFCFNYITNEVGCTPATPPPPLLVNPEHTPGTITISTVGYGDIAPVTTAGKFVGAALALLGLPLIAIPMPLIMSKFDSYYQVRVVFAFNNCDGLVHLNAM